MEGGGGLSGDSAELVQSSCDGNISDNIICLIENTTRLCATKNGNLPAVDQRPVDEPAIDQPKVGLTAVDQPEVCPTAVDQPIVNESAVDQPEVDLLAVYLSAAEEPARKQQTAVDQSRVDEPAIDPQAGEQPDHPSVDQQPCGIALVDQQIAVDEPAVDKQAVDDHHLPPDVWPMHNFVPTPGKKK
jgi:hypothetical protein